MSNAVDMMPIRRVIDRFHSPITEYDEEEMTKRAYREVIGVLDRHRAWTLGDICEILEIDASDLDHPDTRVTKEDVALAAWSNWGTDGFRTVLRHTSLSEGQFIVLNDYFNDIRDLKR